MESMPYAFFRVRLSVQPKGAGEAELVPPNVLQGLNYRFVIVKDGAEEGIINLDESEPVLKKVEDDRNCIRLAGEQMKSLEKSYPKPRIKNKYRMRTQTEEAGATGSGGGLFELDDNGNRIVDAFQAVRSGFYLMDVPVITGSTNK